MCVHLYACLWGVVSVRFVKAVCIRSGSAWLLESMLSWQWECMFTRWRWRLPSNCPAGTRRWGVMEVRSMQLSVSVRAFVRVCVCVQVFVYIFCACVHLLKHTHRCHSTWRAVIYESTSICKASIDFQQTDGKHMRIKTRKFWCSLWFRAGFICMFSLILCVSVIDLTFLRSLQATTAALAMASVNSMQQNVSIHHC